METASSDEQLSSDSFKDPKEAQDFLKIKVPLESLIIEDRCDAVFECKVVGYPRPVCSWYKNGRPIKPSRRFKITCEQQWYILQIKRIRKIDHGVYTLVCHNESKEVSSRAYLFVSNRYLFEGVYYTRAPTQQLTIVQQLRDLTTVLGGRIQLETKFIIEGNVDVYFLWLRNNDILFQNDRTTFDCSRSHSSCNILNAQLTDTGVYHVIVKTHYGIVASFASVQVTSPRETAPEDETWPIIDEWLPDEVVAYEHENTRLICKMLIDINTSMQWVKDGEKITQTNFIIDDYGDHYIGLRGVNVTKEDQGHYTVVLSDQITGSNDFASSTLIVKSAPTCAEIPAGITVTSALVSAVACCGSKVTFDCSFALQDTEYFYVVWYVGRFRIERTNTLFCVAYKGGQYLLHIKKVVPGMSGEVICELRKAFPNRESVYVNKSTATLSIVPSIIVEREEASHPSLLKPKLYDLMEPCDDVVREAVDPGQRNAVAGNQQDLDTEVFMEISYCRLEEGQFFFQAYSNHYRTISTKVTAHEYLLDEMTGDEEVSLVVIKWCVPEDSIAPAFHIEMGQENGRFVDVGYSTEPEIELRDPQEGTLLRYRVRMVNWDYWNTVATIAIEPTPAATLMQFNNHELRPMNEFKEYYTTNGDKVACGAFGSVILVRDPAGELYAAKVLKTRTAKKRVMAKREFEIMKLLQHPKLVELKNAYTSNDEYVFVMDYFWGGELFERIIQEEQLQEVDVVPYVQQICEGLGYLHQHNIAHLDLKPENIVCLSPNSGQIKIVDFGLARVIVDGHVTRALYGTRDYVAPEILNYDSLSTACDMWSVGVVTYMMLAGVMPFAGTSWLERSINISKAKYAFDEYAFREVSDLARDFVEKLLLLKAKDRMSAVEALSHKWVREGPPKGAKAGHMKRARENLKSYLNGYRARWQRAGIIMIAANRLRKQVRGRALSEGCVTPGGVPPSPVMSALLPTPRAS